LTVLVDTGPLVAAVSRADVWHGRVAGWWSANREPVLIPVTVLPEAAYLIGSRLGAAHETAFARSIAGGEVEVGALDDADLGRAADLMAAYQDLPLGLVDASIVAMAERLDVATILTTDRRHFGVVRPAHCERLRLVP
jgi:predicted nucleic acid-binding protein